MSLIALALPARSLYAQDGDTGQIVVRVRFSEPLLAAIRDAYVARTRTRNLIDAQGPSMGFEALCAGRPIW